MSIPTPTSTSWAVVTGASSGIGTELARNLARRGHNLVLVARRAERLEALATELRGKGVQVDVHACDLANAEQRKRLLKALDKLDVSVLCNNAGLATFGDVTGADAAIELQQVNVNVTALADLTYALVPKMVARGRGAILMVGSTAGFQPLPGNATYAASKAFVNSFSQSLHAELHGTGVTCTLLAPGPVDTEFNQVAGLGKSDGAISRFSITPAKIAEQSINALDHGHRILVPGALAKLAALGGAITPRRLLLPIARHGVAALH